MQTISTAAATDPMAHWRATGGASEATTGEAAATAADDGLTANRVTSPAGGCPPFADDGLTAASASPTYPGFCWDRR